MHLLRGGPNYLCAWQPSRTSWKRFAGDSLFGESGAPIVKNTSPPGPLEPHGLVALRRTKKVPPGTVPPSYVCVPGTENRAASLNPVAVPPLNV